jgi:hypothetical protein
MIVEVRAHRGDPSWWNQQASMTSTDLEAATWAMALASCADMPTLADCLPVLAEKLETMSDPRRRVLMRAVARLGMQGGARTLNAGTAAKGAEYSIWDVLLLAPLVGYEHQGDMLHALPLETSIQMASHDAYSWPIVWAAYEGLKTSPERSLPILEAAEWDLRRPPTSTPPLPTELSRHILREQDKYPWSVVQLADMSLENTRKPRHLRDVSEDGHWFDVD